MKVKVNLNGKERIEEMETKGENKWKEKTKYTNL